MPTTLKVHVSRNVLEWAVQQTGKHLEEKFRNLKDWLSGEKQPTLRQLEQLAHETLIPFGFFFLPKPPEPKYPIPYFRTNPKDPPAPPSPELQETLSTLEQRQDWLRDYSKEIGEKPLPFVQSVSHKTPSAEVARQIRQTLQLSTGWASKAKTWEEAFLHLRRQTEQAGIVVVSNSVVGNRSKRPLNVEEFRGFTLIDPYAPIIFINTADAKAAQMFTLAHELAHVWLGVSAVFDLEELQPARDPDEKFCNQVAAEFLVPTEEFRAYWKSLEGSIDQRITEAAKHFKVSKIVAARRALDLELIPRGQYEYLFHQYQQKEAKPARGGNFYRLQIQRLGRRFVEAVVYAARSEMISYVEAYRLTGLYGKRFEQLASKVLGHHS